MAGETTERAFAYLQAAVQGIDGSLLVLRELRDTVDGVDRLDCRGNGGFEGSANGVVSVVPRLGVLLGDGEGLLGSGETVLNARHVLFVGHLYGGGDVAVGGQDGVRVGALLRTIDEHLIRFADLLFGVLWGFLLLLCGLHGVG